MASYLNNYDFSNNDERNNFCSEIEGIARNLLNKKSPLRQNLKVDYLLPGHLPKYYFGDEITSIRVRYRSGGEDIARFSEGEYVLAPTFEIAETFKSVSDNKRMMAQNIVDAICSKERKMYDEMLAMNCKDGILPIREDLKVLHYPENNDEFCISAYENVGLIMTINKNRRFYFLREKIICLQKLTQIPESWDEVYYTHKSKFMALLKKL